MRSLEPPTGVYRGLEHLQVEGVVVRTDPYQG